MTIAERIMLIIKKENQTMSQFAEKLNVTPAYISKIKKYPETVPSDRTITDICRIFHINEAWLRTGEGKMYVEKTREVEIAEMTAAMYKAGKNDFRYKLMKLIAQMTPDQIETLKNIALGLSKDINED